MELNATRGDLLAALYWTQSIVERRNTMPILANVLIDAQKDGVRITATDLEVGVRATVEGQIGKEGTVTVNAKKLYEIVRELPGEQVRVKKLENEWVEIRSGKAVFKIVGMEAREYPQFPRFSTEGLVSAAASVLRGMIERTIFSVSMDETRYSLNGVYMEQGDGSKVRMVATDGHRLAFEEQSLGNFGLAKGVILPRKGVAEVKKLLDSGEDGTVSIGFRENMALIVRDKVELFMRLIDGDFPEYSKVIPKGNPNVAKLDHDEFLQALRRVSILSSERYKGVKMEFRDRRLLISTSNPDLGEAVEEAEVEYTGKPVTIGFNARYLIDVLNVLEADCEVKMELKDEVSPSVIRRWGDETYLYVLMPMRL
ncbi:MAG TPA: DNA polymerase III subunit beta [candidate division Zixibacteria bacterium]|nr:DNA polymerase III subunit beta [candidate division Zixibacteria bacterium]